MRKTMILKILKSFSGIGRQLISLLLLMVVSLTLLTSPALAANSVILTNDNYEDVVLRAKKPVVVVVAGKSIVKDVFGISLEELKTKADDYFDDEFQVAVGNSEEDLDIFYKIYGLRPSRPVPLVSVVQDSMVLEKYPLDSTKKLTESFERIKRYLSE